MRTGQARLLWFHEAECRSAHVSGGKGASLAVMTDAGLPVPPGFVIPACALQAAVEESGAAAAIRGLLATIDSDSAASSQAHELQGLVMRSPPGGLWAERIRAAYESLGSATVAVRSSACAEDGDAASYAGQQETYLNIKGAGEVLDRVVRCWASFFGERALFYRRLKGSLSDLGMAVVVQRQLDPEKAGVLFTSDPVRHRRDQMLLEAAWGLGEAVVSGRVIPDHYLVARGGVLKKSRVAVQDVMVVRREDGGTEEAELDPGKAHSQVLTEAEIDALAALGRRSEEIFGGPQDIEWAIEGGEVYLLQSRPITAT